MNEKININRRKFLKSTVLLGTLSSVAPHLLTAKSFYEDDISKSGEDFTLLFQGDSITDGNRTRNNDWNHVMGHGYAYLIASRLCYDFPKKTFHFFNRGI